jgi:hypothetical protein
MTLKVAPCPKSPPYKGIFWKTVIITVGGMQCVTAHSSGSFLSHYRGYVEEDEMDSDTEYSTDDSGGNHVSGDIIQAAVILLTLRFQS